MVNMKTAISSASKKKTGAAKVAPKGDTTQKRRQSKRIQEMQIAAERDGFTNWSEAITAWKNGDYVLKRKA